MRDHVAEALEQEQAAEKATAAGQLEIALWSRIIARQAWADAVTVAPFAKRAALEDRHEKALRELATAAERRADQVARGPQPTQPGGTA